MASGGGFHFVEVDKPAGRRGEGRRRPASQQYATAARKHVMRDIGFARRGTKKRSKTAEEDQPHAVNGVVAVVSTPIANTQALESPDEGLEENNARVSGTDLDRNVQS